MGGGPPSTYQEEDREGVDWQSIRQAHAFILAGGCLALGLRYASTEDQGAAEAIR